MLTSADIVRPALRAAALSLAAIALLAPSARAARNQERCPGEQTVPTTSAAVRAAAAATACLVNAERTARGLRPLSADRDLVQAARHHARDMARRNFFSHVTPGGADLGDRLRHAGYGRPGAGWRAGENLGWGTGDRATPAALVAAWLASPEHRKNMLRRSFRELGVGVAGGAPTNTGSPLPGATYALELGAIIK
jgi:uncharacterized protein YkwD